MFEQIGEGHKIMHEGQSKPELDLEGLERLHAAVSPGPWHSQGFDVYGWEKKRRVFVARTAPVVVGNSDKIIRYLNNADYIVAACNALPTLIQRVREQEGRLAELAQENSNQKRVIQMLEYRVLELKGKPIPMEPRLPTCDNLVRPR